MSLPRRTFLRYAASAAGAPAWLAAAFAQDKQDKPKPSPLVLDALARAGRHDRPLLLLVVPEQEEDEDEPLLRASMEFWGQQLHNATRAGLHDLALCELAAARRSDLVRTLAPREIEVPPGAALAYLIDGEVTPIDPALPELPAWPRGFPPVGPDVDAFESAIHARVDAFEVALREHLLPEPGSLAALAARAEAARTQDDPLPFASARLALERAEAPSPDRVQEVATLARTRVRGGEAPLGTDWGIYGPCGARIGGRSSRSPGVGCGMGCVPAAASRFLALYVQDQD